MKMKNNTSLPFLKEFKLSPFYSIREIREMIEGKRETPEAVEKLLREESKLMDYRKEAREAAKQGDFKEALLNVTKTGGLYLLNKDGNMVNLFEEEIFDFLNPSRWHKYLTVGLEERVYTILRDEQTALGLRKFVETDPEKHLTDIEDKIIYCRPHRWVIPKRSFNLANFIVKELMKGESEKNKRSAAYLAERVAERTYSYEEEDARKLFKKARELYLDINELRKVAEISQRIGWDKNSKIAVDQKIYELEREKDEFWKKIRYDEAISLADAAGMTFEVVRLLQKKGPYYNASIYAKEHGLPELAKEIAEEEK